MRDVAARAGVSVATVSRALAGSPAVAPDARGRVLTAAAELGYVASRLPANLRAKNVRILALVVGNVRNAYFPELIDGCVEAAQRAGFPLIFGDSNEDPERESESSSSSPRSGFRASPSPRRLARPRAFGGSSTSASRSSPSTAGCGTSRWTP